MKEEICISKSAEVYLHSLASVRTSREMDIATNVINKIIKKEIAWDKCSLEIPVLKNRRPPKGYWDEYTILKATLLVQHIKNEHYADVPWSQITDTHLKKYLPSCMNKKFETMYNLLYICSNGTCGPVNELASYETVVRNVKASIHNKMSTEEIHIKFYHMLRYYKQDNFKDLFTQLLGKPLYQSIKCPVNIVIDVRAVRNVKKVNEKVDSLISMYNKLLGFGTPIKLIYIKHSSGIFRRFRDDRLINKMFAGMKYYHFHYVEKEVVDYTVTGHENIYTLGDPETVVKLKDGSLLFNSNIKRIMHDYYIDSSNSGRYKKIHIL